MGVSHYPEKHKKEFLSYIDKFSALSCREDEGCLIMSELLKRLVHKTVDPTLLLTESDWREIVGEKKCSDDYVLCYFLTPQKWYWDFMGLFLKSKDVKIVCLETEAATGFKYTNVVHGGPKEFLELIDSAKMVFTDSFHASLFSSILRTDFYTLERFSAGSMHAPQNLRLSNFFSMIGVDDRFISSSNYNDYTLPKSLDFDSIHNRIKNMSQSSYIYLKESLYEGNL